MTDLSSAELKELYKFGYKELTDIQKEAIRQINEATHKLMETIYRKSPRSADQSAAIRYARLAAMQANAAVVWDSESV